MTYNSYLKEKIINLYLISQKIGKHSVKDEDFNFLDQYFNNEIIQNVYIVSELLQNIIKDYESNHLLQNKIGIDFLNQLIISRERANIFLKPTPLEQPQITIEQKQDLEEKYTELVNKYGLKEFYYNLEPTLTILPNNQK